MNRYSIKQNKDTVFKTTVPLSSVKRMVKQLEKSPLKKPELTFEFFINSFFPEVSQNMLNNLKAEYEKGFKEGYAAAMEENQKTVKLP